MSLQIPSLAIVSPGEKTGRMQESKYWGIPIRNEKVWGYFSVVASGGLCEFFDSQFSLRKNSDDAGN